MSSPCLVEHSAAGEQVAASDRPDTTPRFPWQRMAFGLLASEELWRAARWSDARTQQQQQQTRDAAEAYETLRFAAMHRGPGGDKMACLRGALGAHAVVRAGLGRWEETRRSRAR